mmetsp:Transcript_46996/g.123305  ORF Transcript_46996/g.123305 Transcript_46996/m.123305 type:complete len:201 (-) Transcript_46996:864-1466(-)
MLPLNTSICDPCCSLFNPTAPHYMWAALPFCSLHGLQQRACLDKPCCAPHLTRYGTMLSMSRRDLAGGASAIAQKASVSASHALEAAEEARPWKAAPYWISAALHAARARAAAAKYAASADSVGRAPPVAIVVAGKGTARGGGVADGAMVTLAPGTDRLSMTSSSPSSVVLHWEEILPDTLSSPNPPGTAVVLGNGTNEP